MFSQYFTPSNARSLMFDLTSRCQLRCRRCERTMLVSGSAAGFEHYQTGAAVNPVGGFNPRVDLSLGDVRRVCGETRPERVELTGSFGDSLYHPDLPAILDYLLWELQTEVHFETNGSGRSERWWRDLRATVTRGQGRNPRLRLVFSIDGLSDTNHLYRVGADWESIMTGVRTMVGSGTLVWKFILFSHNEHQVDEARALHRALGFDEIMFVDSRRFTPWWRAIDTAVPQDGADPLEPKMTTWSLP